MSQGFPASGDRLLLKFVKVMNMNTAILADLGSLFALAFLAISFIGWIINLINAQNPPPPPQGQRGAPPRPRDRKVQNEIEQFLREAMGQRAPGGNKPEPQGDVERVPAASTARRKPSRKATPARVPVAPQPMATADEPARSIRPGGNIANRGSIGTQDFGSNISTHLQQHMSERMGEHVTRDLPHSVSQNVSAHLGTFTAQGRDPRTGVRPATALAAETAALMRELRQPAGMRKAIMLREILSPPLALRR